MVEATLNYLRPGGPVNRRFVAPGTEMNTGIYDPYQVRIDNARPLSPTLASHGFQLLRHKSMIGDFTDTDEIDRLYFDEADALIRDTTGADLTVPFGWMRRTSGTTGDGTQPPAAEVHVDLTPDRAERMAPNFLIRQGRDDFRYSRFLIVSLWRTFSPPPQDCPLALCAGHTVRDGEGEPNVMIIVDALPEGDAAFAPIDGEGMLPAASVFTHSPDHRWYYYPDMTRDEAILLTFYDSVHGPNWRVPHTAFPDPAAKATVPRQSIEFRSIAYWEA